MNSTAPIQCEQATGRDIPSGSGNWAFDDGTRTFFDPALALPARGIPRLARLAVAFLAISSMSCCPDPWLEGQQQRFQLTTASAFPKTTRRRITALEARKMALEILYRAEAERAAAAQAEAERGINWEEVS